MKTLLKVLFVGLVLLSACQSNPTESPPQKELHWYTTCGAPVCGPGMGSGENTCGDHQEGQSCSTEGESCDLGNDCGQKLICASADPKLQPGGCPISLSRYKSNIHYLTPAERHQRAQELQQLRLATWKYNFDPTGPTRLGFLLDDAQTSPLAIKADGKSVDLYGSLSLAIAALQEQQQEIVKLKTQVQGLKAELARK